jgi:transcriptional regulator with XRE-family HTH domain
MTATWGLLQGYGSELGFNVQSDTGATSADRLIRPAYLIGTGGVATKRHVYEIWRAITAPFEVASAIAARSAAEQLAFIKHYLSLSVSDLARAVGVQRPTIYAWMQSGSPRRESVERLAMLERLAAHWKTLADRPLGMLSSLALGQGGETFVMLLENATETELRVALDQLAARLRERAPSLQTTLAAYGLPDASDAERAEGRLRAIRRHAARKR